MRRARPAGGDIATVRRRGSHDRGGSGERHHPPQPPRTDGRLRDGRQLTVRRLTTADVASAVCVEAGMGPYSRHLRWFSSHRTDPEVIRDWLAEDRRTVLCGFVADEPVGVVEVIRLDEPATAEIAVEVTDRWQGLGIGTTLLATALSTARADGIRHLQADVLSENLFMQNILRRGSIPFTQSREDEVVHISAELGDSLALPAPQLL